MSIVGDEVRDSLKQSFRAYMNTTWLGFEDAIEFLLDNIDIENLQVLVDAYGKKQGFLNE